jgi:hypothetical protein
MAMTIVLTMSLVLGLAVTPQVDSLPVAAGHLVTGPSSRVQITNTGRQAVTAWSLAITTHPEEGKTHRVVQSSDAYLAEVTRDLPRSSPHLDWLRPGESFDIPLDPQPADASVQVMAVVLEDGTALGEPETLNAIFAHRAAERDELRKVVDTFNAVLPSKSGVAALAELQRRFGASATPGAPDESTPHRSAREAVDAFSQRARAEDPEQVDRSLRSYAAFVRRQYDVAVKHAVRK